jgi:hypothetical protein
LGPSASAAASEISLIWSSIRASLGLAANSDRWDWIEKLPVLFHVAVWSEAHEILEKIIAPLTSLGWARLCV